MNRKITSKLTSEEIGLAEHERKFILNSTEFQNHVRDKRLREKILNPKVSYASLSDDDRLLRDAELDKISETLADVEKDTKDLYWELYEDYQSYLANPLDNFSKSQINEIRQITNSIFDQLNTAFMKYKGLDDCESLEQAHDHLSNFLSYINKQTPRGKK